MKFSKKSFVLPGLLIFMALVFRVHAEEIEAGEKELSNLPEKVRAAAEASQKDIVLTGYNIEDESGQLLYEVKGTVGAQCYEMEITEEGKILETEECD